MSESSKLMLLLLSARSYVFAIILTDNFQYQSQPADTDNILRSKKKMYKLTMKLFVSGAGTTYPSGAPEFTLGL